MKIKLIIRRIQIKLEQLDEDEIIQISEIHKVNLINLLKCFKISILILFLYTVLIRTCDKSDDELKSHCRLSV